MRLPIGRKNTIISPNNFAQSYVFRQSTWRESQGRVTSCSFMWYYGTISLKWRLPCLRFTPISLTGSPVFGVFPDDEKQQEKSLLDLHICRSSLRFSLHAWVFVLGMGTSQRHSSSFPIVKAMKILWCQCTAQSSKPCFCMNFETWMKLIRDKAVLPYPIIIFFNFWFSVIAFIPWS